MPLSIAEFVTRWKISSLSERSGSQTHFIDLCNMLGQPHPAAADATGERFTFDKPVSKVYGGKGFADVWLRDHFAWEYKGKHKDLGAAYKQLNDYREELGNPPLLVVCDMNLFEIHTNFTNTRPRIYSFNLDDLKANQVTPTCPLPPLEVLRALFGDYNVLRPNRTDAYVTQEAAKVFSRLAERLEIEKRSHTDSPINTKEEIAHFLMRLLFCLFADNIGLLPDHLFRALVQSDDRFSPRTFLRKLRNLFRAMSEDDGIFGIHTIKYFNGGLFDSDSVISLDVRDLGILYEASKNYDWSRVAPEIFGTLFERSLNAKRRSLIGAHYTSAEDILLLIEPVVMRPLEARWASVRGSVLATLESGKTSSKSLLTSNPQAETLLAQWFDELAAVRVLDPACGSGNFLYLALRRLLDLWDQARTFAIEHNIQLAINYAIQKMVSPQQLFGIETEFYAHELASIVVWIGFLQWKREHGIIDDPKPILQRLSNIEHADAILRYDAEGNPYEPQWPKADFIVGNPPFLGDKKMRRELDVEPHPNYTDDLRALYEGRVPGGADLVTFWFEKARSQIEGKATRRAGLIATNSIRQGANRSVLERIVKWGAIFEAWSDRPWLLEGAAVRVSLIAFDDGSERERVLDERSVSEIHADLSAGDAFITANQLTENEGICFLGMMKGGGFDIDSETARKMLSSPVNPNGRKNSDVVKQRLIGLDILRRPSNGWVIDFTGVSHQEAALYELPFQYVVHNVRAKRLTNDDALMKKNWWLFGRTRPALRKALKGLQRCIVTAEIAKHRLFVWMRTSVIPDHRLHVFAREDDYFFGLLQSSTHVEWSLRLGSTFEDRPSYNSDTIFLTFPFPWPPGTEPSEADSPIVRAIAEAARELVRLRDAWLNPPGSSEEDLKSRTLTKLYNERPTWLDNAHRTLDEAVFAAYGWPSNLTTQQILANLLALNHERAAKQAT
jgi:hypothetical protein